MEISVKSPDDVASLLAKHCKEIAQGATSNDAITIDDGEESIVVVPGDKLKSKKRKQTKDSKRSAKKQKGMQANLLHV